MKSLTVNQDVKTPYGVGVVWGRIRNHDGKDRIIVAHDPRKCSLPEELLAGWRGGPSCLWHYDPEDLEVV